MSANDLYAAAATTAKTANDLYNKASDGASIAGGNVIDKAMGVGKGVLDALGAPARGAAGVRSYVDSHGLEGGKIFGNPAELGHALQQGGQFFMDPKKQAETSRIDRDAFSTKPGQGGFIPTDEQINAHLSGLPATIARGGAQAVSEILADPTTLIPGGAIPKLIKGASKVTRLSKVAEAVGKSGVGQTASALFNPEHHLGGLTKHGQNVVESVRNRVNLAAEEAKRSEDLAISQNRKAIKAGVVPGEVTAAFAKYGAQVPPKAKPSALIEALDEARKKAANAKTKDTLRAIGLISGNSTIPKTLKVTPKPGYAPTDLFKDPSAADAAREGVKKHITPEAASDNVALKAISKGNQRLKSMFLAVPFPHVANLTNLAYNKYGLATTLRGLAYAAQEATGKRQAKLVSLIDDLKKSGADNQYGKLFNEINGAPIVGNAIVGVQKFANKAQDTVLNPVERGLRASMMQAEQAAGRTGADAARNIHKALGSDAETGMTKFLSHVPLSTFPRFHTQTALGSFGRTLVDKPGRITGFEHVFGGPDRKQDGTAHYHLSTPSAAGLSMLNNPLKFVASPATLGGLSDFAGPYSPVGEALKGYAEQSKGRKKASGKDYRKAASSLTAPVIPASAIFQSLSEIAKNKKGTAHETGAQDLLSSLVGGYWSRK